MTPPLLDTSDRVVYTAVLGGVDLLLPPERVAPGWDYVCFTDQPVDCPPWRAVPVAVEQRTLSREARYLKVNATTVLPAARLSLWVDGNIQPLCSPAALVERHLDGRDLALHQHPQRDCLFDEAVAIIDQGKDDTAPVLAQVLRYARAGLLTNAGLHATASIVRRHTAAVRELEATWWAEIAAGSHRDQLSLPYALWTHRMGCAELPGDVWSGTLFRYREHDGPNAPRKLKLPDGRKIRVAPR